MSAFEDELREWMRGLAVPDRSAGLEPGPATDNASPGPSPSPDGTSRTGVRVLAALIATTCLACIGAFWVLRSPDRAAVPHVASFRLQVGMAGAGPFEMKVAEGHPAAVEFDRSSISLVAGRATGGLHVVFYDGEVGDSGTEQPPLAEVTLPFPGTSARPVRVTWPRGALELAWIGH